ncbi:hypothetical protein ASPWEDRAFT_37975 [Aspergillus wentii DTO 134E9]|uniref:Uncharacterized protein n=1 Tax=Aspergillus wentii DTO 134E9 TaxID=1073089 RepID=A0A1L9RN79_ASPWE|nr:uncharacterized protein ASPWEDRAFT_37975 [Aspergillus wentii DTO 134E9]KAI9926066.1 hypothetical protein MW887_004525 [Aspergillus wentii]OJJ36409.1 hypothetical protein ASPWEDRAFT_37975 [Aspergillus wentii DTO 134E9]
MKLYAAFIALVTSSAVVMASPAPSLEDGGNIVQRSWKDGKCNGTKCRIGWEVEGTDCDYGSCAGPDGGDNTYCYQTEDSNAATYCPGAT